MRKTIFTGLIVCIISLVAIVLGAMGAPGDLLLSSLKERGPWR